MTHYIVCIALGPVQGFIAAARRTRDLWFGSYMLSEVSKAAAYAASKNNGQLIFPAPKVEDDLCCDSDLNVANVILFEKESDSVAEIERTVACIKDAAQNRWESFADDAKEKTKNIIDKGRWNYQLKGVVEFYAAWCPLQEGGYKESRSRVMCLLRGRKDIRDFSAWKGETLVAKSSLDGARESVLLPGYVFSSNIRIKKGEALDIVGVVKRTAGDERFPSVSRVAVDGWIRNIVKTEPDALKEIKEACEKLAKAGVISRALLPLYNAFPYDGTVFFPQRYNTFDLMETNVELLCKKITALIKKYKEPSPYLAFIAADGDRMGMAISHLGSSEAHRVFSQTLSLFAQMAKKIVAGHNGVLVYSGGDDVLAYTPVEKSLECARELSEAFCSLWKDKRWDTLEKRPTLSVGVSIAHCMENLNDLLAFARSAESLAKKGEGESDRNGLAVIVRARNNSEIAVREQWQETAASSVLANMSLDARITYWAKLFSNKRIPSKFPYEVRSIADFYNNWQPGVMLDMAMQDDIKRIFRRKDLKLMQEERSVIEDYIDVKIKNNFTSISTLSKELIIAQWVIGSPIK